MKPSLAIAYAVKRKAKKMADGGPVKSDPNKGWTKKEKGDFEKGATDSGWKPDQWLANAKSAFKAAGGLVDDEDMAREMDPIPPMTGEDEDELIALQQYLSPKKQGAFMAHGGMMDPKVIAIKIMGKKMAEGGEASLKEKMAKMGEGFNKSLDEGVVEKFKKNILGKKMADGGEVSQDNKGAEDHPDNDWLSDEEQSAYWNPNQADLHEEDAKERRKAMLKKIFRGV